MIKHINLTFNKEISQIIDLFENLKKLDQKLNQFFNKFNITSNYIPQFDPTERLH